MKNKNRSIIVFSFYNYMNFNCVNFKMMKVPCVFKKKLDLFIYNNNDKKQ